MRSARLGEAAIVFALRRLRERWISVTALGLAFAGAAGLIGWGSIMAALSQEDNVRLRLQEVSLRDRSVQVLHTVPPASPDFTAEKVGGLVARSADVTEHIHRTQVWHPLSEKTGGVRLVVAGAPREQVRLSNGALPAHCRDKVCEAVALAGRYRIGERVSLGRGIVARVVGRGSLTGLPPRVTLERRALLVAAVDGQLEKLVEFNGSVVSTTAPLDANAVEGSRLRELIARLRADVVRLSRLEKVLDAAGPQALLEELADRGEVARERLLLVSGQGAALILAFAAFAAGARRRDTQLAEEQLDTLGASRAQRTIVRAAEVLVPTVAAALVAIAALFAAAWALAQARDLPGSFVGAAVPMGVVVAIGMLTAVAAALLFAAVAPRRQRRFGLGGMELAAITALGLVVWQASSTGALDADRIAEGERASPVLLVVPALAFFAAAVLLLRLLPLLLRLAERLARKGPIGVRLAFLTAARSPEQAAASTTFLAVALGGSLFALNYASTLEQQARDEASFAAGAEWRVVEHGQQDRSTQAEEPALSDLDVTPLTRYAEVSHERPTPVVRLNALLREDDTSDGTPVEVLALPAAQIPRIAGWREDFSDVSRAEIARRVRPRPVRLSGHRIAPGARSLRVWARSTTELPRLAVLHFLLPGQQFGAIRLGVVTKRWRRLRVRLTASLRGGELIGVEILPTSTPLGFDFDRVGFAEFGRFDQRQPSGWSPLPSLETWTAAALPGSAAAEGFVEPYRSALGPVRRGVRFHFRGTHLPLMHPSLPVPDPIPGLASRPIAAAAVDGTATIDIAGHRFPVRVIGHARLFPSVRRRPEQFLVLDYDTLFAALNIDRPGLAVPTEAWFLRAQPAGFERRLARAPFRLETMAGLNTLTQRRLNDPLAAGTRKVLGVTALAAAALGLLGLLLATRATLASERLTLAEYEALGIPPTTLARSTQIRLLALSALGIAAGLIGALIALQMVAAFVAVAGTAARPLPPIQPGLMWGGIAAIVGAVGVLGLVGVAALATRALRETTAARLRL